MSQHSAIHARPIPSTDLVFGRVVESVAASARSAEQLAAELRPIYPDIAVSERLISDEPRAVYVYRDGFLKPERHDAWWNEPGAPRVEIDLRTGIIDAANDGWAALVGQSTTKVVGRPYTDFLAPDAIPAARSMLAILRETGHARSSAVVCRADGGQQTIDFRAILEDHHVTVWYRPR